MILGKVRSQALSHLHRCLSQFPQFEANESVAIFPKGSLLVDRWFLNRHFHHSFLTVHRYPFILLAGERHCGSGTKVQNNDALRSRTQTLRYRAR